MYLNVLNIELSLELYFTKPWCGLYKGCLYWLPSGEISHFGEIIEIKQEYVLANALFFKSPIIQGKKTWFEWFNYKILGPS